MAIHSYVNVSLVKGLTCRHTSEMPFFSNSADRQAPLPSVPCNILETLSILLTTKRKREIHFLHTVADTHRTLCTKQTANYEIFLFLYRAFSVHRILCVPQYKENELLSFFSS